ncbi:MAG: hypothetical protein QOG05_1531 [Streptosporangiaceae bacterium]|nr:hypothetical protein [Streptosporangiaceae bacterium]
MNGTVVVNLVIGALIVLIIVGVPLWLTLRRRHARPDYREARAHYQAKADPSVTPLSDYVPAEPVAATDGLAVPQTPLDEASTSAGDAGTPAGDPGQDGPSRADQVRKRRAPGGAGS